MDEPSSTTVVSTRTGLDVATETFSRRRRLAAPPAFASPPPPRGAASRRADRLTRARQVEHRRRGRASTRRTPALVQRQRREVRRRNPGSTALGGGKNASRNTRQFDRSSSGLAEKSLDWSSSIALSRRRTVPSLDASVNFTPSPDERVLGRVSVRAEPRPPPLDEQTRRQATDARTRAPAARRPARRRRRTDEASAGPRRSPGRAPGVGVQQREEEDPPEPAEPPRSAQSVSSSTVERAQERRRPPRRRASRVAASPEASRKKGIPILPERGPQACAPWGLGSGGRRASPVRLPRAVDDHAPRPPSVAPARSSCTNITNHPSSSSSAEGRRVAARIIVRVVVFAASARTASRCRTAPARARTPVVSVSKSNLTTART